MNAFCKLLIKTSDLKQTLDAYSKYRFKTVSELQHYLDIFAENHIEEFSNEEIIEIQKALQAILSENKKDLFYVEMYIEKAPIVILTELIDKLENMKKEKS